MPSTDGMTDELLAKTSTFLQHVTESTETLATALDAYGTDGDAFERELSRLVAVESACDNTLHELRRTVGSELDPSFSGAYLRKSDLLELYTHVDRIPTELERFARQLRATEPSLTDSQLATFVEMTDHIDTAARTLTAAISTFVERLVTGGTGGDPTATVERVAALESACDQLKYDALGAAFDGDEETSAALLVRDLLVCLDAAMNAVEDAADHLLFASGTTLP
ncbi:DUF47 domain-containing protein [Haloarchaeobius iranensis]|uniref:Uncharacterized conserved protein YkaA, UPF0111/DUF47 family n=1 Tax=Haloarchaeobius iranensis TaxID=996166 RepID=A0A1G9W1T2_9EURY|nr:DUF47 family protein [Haloarchaeobius iranensis]SDM78151.1 Uncharacterized conserved protein YkaA, UPF0111/DUF47 family [Haloarchaeobius iranensis]